MDVAALIATAEVLPLPTWTVQTIVAWSVDVAVVTVSWRDLHAAGVAGRDILRLRLKMAKAAGRLGHSGVCASGDFKRPS